MNNTLLIIIILIIIFILYLLYLCMYKYEKFYNDDDYVYINDNIDNISEPNKHAITSTKLIDIIDNININKNLSKEVISIDTNKFKFIIDPYISKYILNNSLIKANAVYKEGIFVCLSHIRIGVEKCIWDFTGKTIAYIYMSDYLFIQAIIKAYRQDIQKIKLRKIKVTDLRFLEKQFDYLFTYVVIGSEYMNILKYSRYYINGLRDFDYHRLKLFYPVIENNNNNIRYYFNKNDENTTYNPFLSNNTELIPIMKYDIIKNYNIDIIENFITRLEFSKDYLEDNGRNYENKDNINDTLTKGIYSCYGNNNIKNKFECNSYYTKEGLDKNYYSVWDKKCYSNDECPYYKANTKYNNERGGCIDGYCELPIGVKRIGFTKYDDSGYNKPFCYECQDTTDLNCCANIKNIDEKNYNNDFVFQNDTEDRINNNLNTIISLLDYRNI